MSFSAFLTTSSTSLVSSTAEYQKDIDICYSPWQNLLPVSIYVWYSDALYTSQVLEVVRNGKHSIFLPILLNLSPNKSPFNQYYPKSVPHPDILIILLSKNDKIDVLVKILLLTIFLSKLSKMHWRGRLSTSDFFFSWIAITCLSLYFVICMR